MPSPPDTSLATQLLQQSERDDDSHGAELLELVGAELRRLAAGYLRREPAGHTLQPTALVNEAYLKLIDSTAIRTGDRERFLALAALAMRQVLVDFARKRKTAKRGGEHWDRVSLNPDMLDDAGASRDGYDLIELLSSDSKCRTSSTPWPSAPTGEPGWCMPRVEQARGRGRRRPSRASPLSLRSTGRSPRGPASSARAAR